MDKKLKKTIILLFAVAILFYLGFIYMAVMGRA